MANALELILYGNKGVGKETILNYWKCDKFSEERWKLKPTERSKQKGDVPIRVLHRQGSISDMFGTNTKILLYAFDLSRSRPFFELFEDLQTIRTHSMGLFAIIIIGNKVDLTKSSTAYIDIIYRYLEGLPYYANVHLTFFTASAKTGENLGIVYKYLCELIQSI